MTIAQLGNPLPIPHSPSKSVARPKVIQKVDRMTPWEVIRVERFFLGLDTVGK
jgi:hypothetical protein